MRLTPILIAEGRKEDLRKKYEQKFSIDPELKDLLLPKMRRIRSRNYI